MDRVKVAMTIANRRLRPHERLGLKIEITNISAQPLTLPAQPGYTVAFNGEISEGTSQMASLESYSAGQTAAPGETICYSYSQGLELVLIPAAGAVAPVQLLVGLGFDDFNIDLSEEIAVDFSGFRNLAPEIGETSEFFASGDVIFHYSRHRRGSRCLATVLKGKVQDYRILTPQFAVGQGRVYNRDTPVRGVGAEGFRAFNLLFVGNDDLVMTSYGNAKVEDPKTFAVLDDGSAPPQFSSPIGGYRCSFARDARFAYFFDESTSTPHALRIRGCKDPSRLEAIGYAYARDDQNVFFQSVKVRKADPGSFRLLNRRYATDGRHVFSFEEIVEGADPQSFQVLPTRSWRGDPDRMLSSDWARDANRFYERGHESSEAEYLDHLERGG